MTWTIDVERVLPVINRQLREVVLEFAASRVFKDTIIPRIAHLRPRIMPNPLYQFGQDDFRLDPRSGRLVAFIRFAFRRLPSDPLYCRSEWDSKGYVFFRAMLPALNSRQFLEIAPVPVNTDHLAQLALTILESAPTAEEVCELLTAGSGRIWYRAAFESLVDFVLAYVESEGASE